MLFISNFANKNRKNLKNIKKRMKTKKRNDLFSLARPSSWKRGKHCLLAATLLLAGSGAGLVSCSDYDLDTTTPEGWGSSVYSWLDEQGNYTNTVRLINDLKYGEVLAKTGSKTLFVANDEAYQRFFQNNPWGVGSYEQLSTSQKRMLLFGNMIDNSIQLNNLSNVQGTPPREGEAMRRFSSMSPFDSVAVLTANDMPNSPYWKQYRESGKPMVCMTDNSTTTILQFIEKQLVNKRITNDDYGFLFNRTANRQPGDASINGVAVSQPNIRCSNGFIHELAEVATPLPNMAEMIRKKAVASEFNRILERYCAPYPDMTPQANNSITMQYNNTYGTHVDTVYQKRFFSDKSQDGLPLNLTPKRSPVTTGKLLFDPEWNAYFTGNNDLGGNVAMQRDMAVMMVPSNKALDEYWQSGAGKVLRERYGTWDNVPDEVAVELINNNMLPSFINSVPSKFEGILNDANDPMGVTPEAIDSVWLCCNGAIFLTNRVYSPTKYVSVVCPPLTNEALKILYWAIEKEQYTIYLNSLNSYYSFFVPTNKSLLEYVDPGSYGKPMAEIMRFRYDEKTASVKASKWRYDRTTGELSDSTEVENEGIIRNRLKDVLDTHIVVGNVEDGHEYYRTKGGTEIRVKNTDLGANGMTVEGSFQINEGQPLRVSRVYDQTEGGNGKCYVLDEQPILTTRITVDSILGQHPEFARFRELMNAGDSVLEQIHNERNATAGTNVRSFNTYHYTIYVPTNESIEALQKAHKLPTVEEVENLEMAGDELGAQQLKRKIADFVKYHIQDNALFIGAENDEADFETAVIDPSTQRFYRVKATLTESGIELEDQACKKNPNRPHPHVVTTNPNLYNLMAREYQYDAKFANDQKQVYGIYTSSSAVIHQIDTPLLIEN